MAVTGSCRYEFNASERYRRPDNGDHCGLPTYAVVDVPEVLMVPTPDGSVQMVTTGRKLAREQFDPHCPLHGGTPDPEAPAGVPVAEGTSPGAASTADGAAAGEGEEVEE